MPSAETCPKCKFPIKGEGSTCRLCGEPLQGSEVAAPEIDESKKQTTAVARPDLSGAARVAAVEALFLGGVGEAGADGGPDPQPAEDASPGAPEEVAAWIICPPLEPVPLARASAELFIGRTKSHSQFVLPHHAVSRRHAAVRVRDGAIEVEDLSSNGTFLNGKRVEKATVRIGDVLTIGPYDLDLAAQRSAAEDAGAHTSEFDFASITSGLIEGNTLAETLQGLEFNAKTGTLKVLAGQLRGLLVVRDGRPQFAAFGDTHDDAAVLSMLDLNYGRYTFFPTAEAGPCSMQRPLTALLFDHSRHVDES